MKPAKHATIVAYKLSLILVVSCCCLVSFAQQDNNGELPALPEATAAPSVPGWLHLRNIVITGNKKTKGYIIKREMEIAPGDSILIATLTKTLEEMRQNIYNTTLFVTVKVEPILLNAFECDIIVTVKERFYIFPLPQFQLTDRSFDEWIGKYKASLSRVNYGVKFVDYNVSGRKDQLRLNLINGYTRNISASYTAPYSNAKLTNGFYINGGFAQSKEIPYKTDHDNNLNYFKNGKFVRDYYYLNAGYTIRRAIKYTQIMSVGFSHIQVSDSIVSKDYNPGYFNTSSPSQSFVDLTYTLQYNNVDNILYPLEGVSGYATVLKRGLGFTGGVNMFSIEGEYNKFISLGNKWYTSLQFAGNIKLPFKQPFVNQRALGDNIFLRGLEYYTIDGVAFCTAKFNLKREILKFTVPTFIKSKTYNKIPFKFYAKIFTDLGYVYSVQKPVSVLNNKLLPTTGIGLDILTIYDLHLRLDYSLNQLGQKRLAVNNRSGF